MNKSILEEMSLEDRRRLNLALRNEIASEKARYLNTDPENVTRRIVNGEYRWVGKGEISALVHKRTRLSERAAARRMLRDGENGVFGAIRSLEGDIRGELERLAKEGTVDVHRRMRIENDLNNAIERAGALAGDLGKCESRIETLKGRNPVFGRCEALLADIRRALLEGRAGDAARLKAQNEAVIQEYGRKRLELDPLIEEARRIRFHIQEAHRDLCETARELGRLEWDALRGRVRALAETQGDGAENDLLEMDRWLESLAARWRGALDEWPEAGGADANPAADRLIDGLKSMLGELRLVISGARSVAEQYRESRGGDGPPDGKVETGGGCRMAYWKCVDG